MTLASIDNGTNPSCPPVIGRGYPTEALKSGVVCKLVPGTLTTARPGHVAKAATSSRPWEVWGIALGNPPTAAQGAANAYGDAATAASTSQPINLVLAGEVEAQVESGVAAGDYLVLSGGTAGKLQTRPADLHAIVAGANANTSITVTGLRKEHKFKSVTYLIRRRQPRRPTTPRRLRRRPFTPTTR
jgi:hypothetical protein